MGLGQGDESAVRALPARALAAAAVIVALSGVLLMTGDSGRELLRFDRAGIEAGQFWRLLSGHLVHLGTTHFLLNAAGLLLLAGLTGGAFSLAGWGLVVFASLAAIDLGLWLLEPGLQWYVGLSGILHGILAAVAVDGLWRRSPEGLVIATALLVKLGYEQFFGAVPGSMEAAGGNVVVAAHLYGSIGGALAALLPGIRVGATSSI